MMSTHTARLAFKSETGGSASLPLHKRRVKIGVTGDYNMPQEVFYGLPGRTTQPYDNYYYS